MSDASIYQAQSTTIPVANSLGNIFLEWQTATAGQTVFNILSFQYTPGTNTLMVYKKPVGATGGSFMQIGIDYAETDMDTVTFVTPFAVGDKVAFLAFATEGVAIPNGGGLPAGGTSGQILSKIDNSDYNAHWINQATAIPLLDAPMQTLASANTVDLSPLANVTRNISLSGAVNISGFQVANGELFSCRITGTFQFVNSASLICPGNVNINAVPSASCFLRAVADNVVEILCYSAPVASAAPITVRQSVQSGIADSTGDAAFLVAGTGLAVDLVASATDPLVIAYAAGSTDVGDTNYVESLPTSTANAVTALAPSNLTYITKTYQGAWGKTLAPCQYERVFNRTAQMLVRWPGANNATATTEDFGNTFTFFGNAKLSTGTQILGLNTLACDGTGDYVTTPFTYVGNESWEIFGSFRTAALGATQTILNVGIGAGFGILLGINAAGKTLNYISSGGASWDIANAVVGVTTLVINTTYYFRYVFDSVAGTYKVYLSNNGAAETTESTTASTSRVCMNSLFSIGADIAGASGFNGNIGFIGFRRWASFTSAQAAGPSVAPTYADVRTDFFNISKMKMYEVTAVSTVAGTDPTLSAVNRIHTSELTTSGVGVTSVINYAYKGQYTSAQVAGVNVGTTTTFTHKIGVPGVEQELKLVIKDNASGYNPGTIVSYAASNNGTAYTPLMPRQLSRTVSFVTTGSSTSYAVWHTTSGNITAVAYTSINQFLVAKRPW